MTGRGGVRGRPGTAPDTTAGSDAVRAVESSTRIAAVGPRPKRGAVIARGDSAAHAGHTVVGRTSLIETDTSNGPQSTQRYS